MQVTTVSQLAWATWATTRTTRRGPRCSTRSWSRGAARWGSVFSRDEFTDKEVQDTDNDGLPEFVDAWGQPLQFFRWPTLYHSDLQRGQLILTGQRQTWDLLPPYCPQYRTTACSASVRPTRSTSTGN